MSLKDAWYNGWLSIPVVGLAILLMPFLMTHVLAVLQILATLVVIGIIIGGTK